MQWDIVRLAFGEGADARAHRRPQAGDLRVPRRRRLRLPARPRGAPARSATLEVNWRSDQGLLEAYDALFGDARLGHEGIAYRSVRAAGANRAPRLLGAPRSGAAAHARRAPRRPDDRQDPLRLREQRLLARATSRSDLAGDLVALLSSGARIERRAEDGAVLGHEPVRPGHVAVLVRTHRQAALVRDALDAVEIPAVINGAGSVFGSEPGARLAAAAGGDRAPERARPRPRRGADAVPRLGRRSGSRRAAEDEWEEVHRRLHEWARVLRVQGRRGAAGDDHARRGPARPLLSEVDGERRLTDLRHVGQLLHAAAAAERLGRDRADRLAAPADRRRRAGDAATRSAAAGWSPTPRPCRCSRSTAARASSSRSSTSRTCGSRPGSGASERAGLLPRPGRRRRAHDRRRARRAATSPRTSQQHVDRGSAARTCGSPTSRSPARATRRSCGGRARRTARDSALSRLLFARAEDGTVAPNGPATPSDLAAVTRLNELAARGARADRRRALDARAGRGRGRAWPGRAGGRSTPPRSTASSTGAGGARRSATSRPAPTRRAWRASPRRRCSPTSPTPPRRRAGAAAADAGRAARGARRAGRTCGVGVRVGTLVHRVLEATDFAAADLRAELAAPRRRGAGAAAGGARRRRARRRRAWRPRSRRRSGRSSATCGCATSRAPTGSTSSPSSCRSSAATTRPAGVALERDRRRARRAPRRRATRSAATRRGWRDPALRESVRGFLTGSLDLVLRLARRALRDRRPQDELARGAGRGADRLAPPARGARGRDGARALRPAGAALHRRAAPLPALAAAGLRPRRATSRACCTCSCAG